MLSELEQTLQKETTKTVDNVEQAIDTTGTIDTYVDEDVFYSGPNNVPSASNLSGQSDDTYGSDIGRNSGSEDLTRGKRFTKQIYPKKPSGNRGIQENKLIDKEKGNTTVYTKPKNNGAKDEIYHTPPNTSHKKKEKLLDIDYTIDYENL